MVVVVAAVAAVRTGKVLRADEGDAVVVVAVVVSRVSIGSHRRLPRPPVSLPVKEGEEGVAEGSPEAILLRRRKVKEPLPATRVLPRRGRRSNNRRRGGDDGGGGPSPRKRPLTAVRSIAGAFGPRAGGACLRLLSLIHI